jgi:hypothetical protein
MSECDVDLRQFTNIAVGISVTENECVCVCVCVRVCVHSQFTLGAVNEMGAFSPRHYTEFYLAS